MYYDYEIREDGMGWNVARMAGGGERSKMYIGNVFKIFIVKS